MFTQADLKKPTTHQFSTFKGSKRDYLYVQKMAEKQGVSYTALMNVMVTKCIASFQELDAFKLTDEEMEELYKQAQE